MAQFFVDDADFDINDFTVRVDGGGDCTPAIVNDTGLSADVLEIDGTDGERRFVSWDTPGSPTDVEILVFAKRVTTSGNTGTGLGTGVRGSGTDETDVSAYRSATNGSDQHDETLNKYVSGSFTEIQEETLVISDGHAYHWNRLRVDGTDVKSKRWDGTIGDEPAAWTIEVTDSDISGAGWVGLFMFAGAVHRIAQIGVGTNGDTAPSEAVSSNDPANLQATVDGADVTLTWDASF